MPRLRPASLLILLALLLVPPLAGCSSPVPVETGPDTLAELRSIGQRAIDEDGIVGCSIAVALDGEIVFAEGFGHADLARTTPAHPGTVYDIASVGKQFTAALVLRLAEQGRISLDAPVRSLVPELPDNFPDATIEQLLRHTSGFVGAELDEQDPPEQMTRPRFGLALLDDPELTLGKARFEPGETWVYCNPGYLAAGIAAEAATGGRYDQLVRRELLEPNGLDGLYVCERAEGPDMAQAIHRTKDGYAPAPYIDMTAYAGQGSVCSSVVDLLAWSRALNEGRVVSKRSLRAMRTPSSMRGDHDSVTAPYGMAQRIGSLGPSSRVGHTGTFDGGSAALVTYPEAGLEIAVLSNTYGGGTPHARKIETAVAKRLLGVAPIDVQSLRVPLPADAERRTAGVYSNGTNTMTPRYEGETLVEVINGKDFSSCVHVGGLVFRSIDEPDALVWFASDGDRAGWWIYSLSGHIVDVARRVAIEPAAR